MRSWGVRLSLGYAVRLVSALIYQQSLSDYQHLKEKSTSKWVQPQKNGFKMVLKLQARSQHCSQSTPPSSQLKSLFAGLLLVSLLSTS